LIALPKPVSISAMSGTSTAAAIARIMSRCCDGERMLASGTAWLAESSKPLPHIASNPASAASFADKGLCADMACVRTGSCSFWRKRALRFMAGRLA
jgi:hypothetical protein